MRARRTFTREFKLSVINELNSGKTAAQICRERNISSSTLSDWKRDYEKNPNEAFSGYGNMWKEEAKIAEYERLLGQAHAEIAFLKKTLEYLQKRRAEEKMRLLL